MMTGEVGPAHSLNRKIAKVVIVRKGKLVLADRLVLVFMVGSHAGNDAYTLTYRLFSINFRR